MMKPQKLVMPFWSSHLKRQKHVMPLETSEHVMSVEWSNDRNMWCLWSDASTETCDAFRMMERQEHVMPFEWSNDRKHTNMWCLLKPQHIWCLVNHQKTETCDACSRPCWIMKRQTHVMVFSCLFSTGVETTETCDIFRLQKRQKHVMPLS